jgi:hypothetical protein
VCLGGVGGTRNYDSKVKPQVELAAEVRRDVSFQTYLLSQIYFSSGAPCLGYFKDTIRCIRYIAFYVMVNMNNELGTREVNGNRRFNIANMKARQWTGF